MGTSLQPAEWLEPGFYFASNGSCDLEPRLAGMARGLVRIGDHDFETKLRRAEGFLNHGHKVKLTLQFRGRENEHRDLGFVRVNLAKDESGLA